MPGFLATPRPLAFAHRGGNEVAPENTMEAFESAWDLGYRYLETDVHLSSDGAVVAFHDSTLDRVTDCDGEIASLPWSQVRAARIDGEFRIPLLSELLQRFPDAYFNIDPKHDAVVGPLATLLQQNGAVDRVCVGSFSDARLTELGRRLGPRLCRALGPRQIAKLVAASRSAPVGTIRGSCAQVPRRSRGRILVDERFVAAAHSRKIDVHVWTVNEAAEMHLLLDLGVDGIMTDRPALLKDVLEVRGQWHKTHRDPE